MAQGRAAWLLWRISVGKLLLGLVPLGFLLVMVVAPLLRLALEAFTSGTDH